MIITAHAHKSGVIFDFFQELFILFILFINIWGIPQQGIGLPWSRGSPNNGDDMHEQVMPVLVNASELGIDTICFLF